MRDYIPLLDLDIYVQNAKLKEQYRLLWEDYRLVTAQIKVLNKELDMLKQELVDLQTKINRWRWVTPKNEEDCWR